MAVNYSGTLKTNRMQLVADLIASKTVVGSSGAGSAGSLVIGTSALSGATGVLATIALQNPPGTVSGAGPVLLTLSGVPLTANASAGGTAALAELRNNAGTAIVSGLTVGTSASDVIVTTVTIVNTQPVTVTSGTITHS
jgi:hypothetical protein